MMESLMKLTVKTPNQRFEDLEINCDVTWTVRKLKEYLQDVYPSKPSSHSQKLIYLGRLLQDHHILKEIFDECISKTLHIVCCDSECHEATKTDNVESTVTDGLRQRTTQSTPQSNTSQQSAPATQQQQQWPPQHPLWQQQHSSQPINLAQYQQAMMQQYMQQMQAYYHYQQMYQMNGQRSMPPTPTATQPPASMQSTPVVENNQQLPLQENVQQPPQAGPVQQAQQRQNMPMNAGPAGAMMAPADDDDDNEVRNRDWLDWIYLCMRAVMLLSIVYFYSSTTRFLLVAVLGFILYIYQAGWITPRPQNDAAPPEAAEQTPPQTPASTPSDETPSDETPSDEKPSDETPSDETPSDETPTDGDATIVEPARPGILRVCMTLFHCFFASLIPTPPPGLQN